MQIDTLRQVPVFSNRRFKSEVHHLGSELLTAFSRSTEHRIHLVPIAERAAILSTSVCRTIARGSFEQVVHFIVELALKHQTVPIVDVAFDCGFATQSQLTKYFSRFVSTTPKVYRDQG